MNHQPFEGLTQFFPEEDFVLDVEAIERYRIIMEGFRDLPSIVEILESREYICELGMLDGDSDFIRLKEFAKALQRG